MTTDEKILLEILDKIGTVRAQELLDYKDKDFIQKAEAIVKETTSNPRMIRDVMISLKQHRGFLKSLASMGRIITPQALLQSEYKFTDLLRDKGYDISDETVNDLMYCRPKVNKVASGCGEILILLTIAGARTTGEHEHGDIKVGDRLIEVGSNHKRMWGQGEGLNPREIHKRFYDLITKRFLGIHRMLDVRGNGKIASITSPTGFGQLLWAAAEKYGPESRKTIIEYLLKSLFEDTPEPVINWLLEKAMERIEYLDNFDKVRSVQRYGQVASCSIATLVMLKYAAEDDFTDFLFIDNDTLQVSHIDMRKMSLNEVYRFCCYCKWGSMFGFGSMDASIQLRRTYDGDIDFKRKKNPRDKHYTMPDWIHTFYNPGDPVPVFK